MTKSIASWNLMTGKQVILELGQRSEDNNLLEKSGVGIPWRNMSNRENNE
jgi:hypothetical protein